MNIVKQIKQDLISCKEDQETIMTACIVALVFLGLAFIGLRILEVV